MEKFARFTDSSIGVNPFTLPPPQSGRSFFGYLLFGLRSPFLLPLFIVFITLDYLISVFPSILAFPLRKFLLSPLSRVILVILGFHTIHETHLPRTQQGVNVVKQTKNGRQTIITNMCGFIDVLIWTSLVAPQFTFIDDDGYIFGQTIFETILYIARLGTPSKVSSSEKTSNKKTDQTWLQRETLRGSFAPPLLIQPEGAPTNNKSILEFHPHAIKSLASVYENVQVKCAVLKYPAANTSASPCFVSGDSLTNLLAIAMQFSNSVQVLWVNKEDLQELGTGGEVIWGASIRESLCKALKVKAVKGLNRNTHTEFVIASSKR